MSTDMKQHISPHNETVGKPGCDEATRSDLDTAGAGAVAIPSPILEIRDLKCGYDCFHIEDIDLTVNTGDFLGIIGPNGSGKTSLLRAVTRILKPIKGNIYLEGKNIREIGFKDMARRIAVVSQDPGVSQISVEDYILLGRIPHHRGFQFSDSGDDIDVAERCMALTETAGFRHQLVGELSGGERQLVLIARALAQEPRLILLDEPTAFLDITHQVRVMDLIKRLNRESGLTVVIVLHDLNLAGEYCNRLVLMKGGRVHSVGEPEEVLTYPIIEEVYDTMVVVGNSPVSSRPYIFLVTENQHTARPA